MNKELVLRELDALLELVSCQERNPHEANGIYQAMEAVERMPDDNPWIPTKEKFPKDHEYARVFMTVQYPGVTTTVKGAWAYGVFQSGNGRTIKRPVLAWKYLRYPKPYKEES